MASQLIDILRATLSPDLRSRQPAEAALKHAQQENPAALLNYALDLINAQDAVETSIRIQAALTIKNSLEKWRKTVPNPIESTAKSSIRQKLLLSLNQENKIIAKALALSIGKIARLDYDADWPSLPDELLSIMASSYNNIQERSWTLYTSLLVTKGVVKALVENRMPRGRKLMQKITPIFFNPLSSFYSHFWSLISTSLSNREYDNLPFQLSILNQLTKILRNLFSYGYMIVAQHQEPLSWFNNTIQHAMFLYQARSSLASHPNLLEQLYKQSRAFGKLFHAENRKLDFDKSIFQYCWTVLEDAGDRRDQVREEFFSLIPLKLVVQAITILRNILMVWPSTELPIEFSEEESDFKTRLSYWAKDCTILLVTRTIPMQDADIDLWNDDPEAWLNEEEAERDEIELRPASIRLFEALLSQFKTVVAPALIEMLKADQIKHANNKHDTMIKEALYCSIGRNPTSMLDGMSDYKPFSQWLTEDLTPELMNINSNNAILRRRIIWLLGGWVGEEIGLQAKADIYKLLLNFLRPSPEVDIATRLTAARAIGKTDSWGFDEKVFAPYFEEVVSHLLALIDSVETIESRMRLMETLGLLIGRMGRAIAPFVDSVMQMLPRLWSTAGDQALYKISMLGVVSGLAEAIQEASQHLHSQFCPLISYGVDASSSDYAFLHEEAINLWRVILRFSSNMTSELASLLPFLINLLQAGTDTLPDALKILESYCLLDVAGLLQAYGPAIFAAFENILGDLKPESVKHILHTFNLLISCSSSALWHIALDSSNCFVKLVLPFQSQESTIVLSKYLCSLSRIAVSDPAAFHALIHSTATKLSTTPQSLLTVLLDNFNELNDTIGNAQHRKLVALALSYLSVTNDPLILTRLPLFVPIWSGALAETEENESGDAVAYSLMDAYDSEGEFDVQESPEYNRRALARNADPVHSLKLSTIIASNLNRTQDLNGGPAAFQAQYLANVDSLVVEELKQRLSGELKALKDLASSKEAVDAVDLSIPHAKKAIEADYSQSSPGKDSVLIITHGAGGNHKAVGMDLWKDGAVEHLPVLRFAGNMNLKARTNSFLQVTKHAMDQLSVKKIFLGGRSMGSRAALQTYKELDDEASKCVQERIILQSFPLIGQKAEDTSREELLLSMPEHVKLLFVVGEKDKMCPLKDLSAVRSKMKATSWLVLVRSAGHGLDVSNKANSAMLGVKIGHITAQWLTEELAPEKRESTLSVAKGKVSWSGWQESLLDGNDEHDDGNEPKRKKRKT